jgi:tetratricopeptide (TPR) repeat protein
MSDDNRSGADGHPGDGPAAPDDPADELLRRLARDVRATPALQAFVPLSREERARLADRAIEQVLGPVVPRASKTMAPRRWWRRPAVAIIGAATAALAAAIVLLLVFRPPAPEPLARYAMVVMGEQTTRGSAASPAGETVLVRPETTVVIQLAAARPERDALLRAVLVRNGRAALLDPPVTRKEGTLEIAAPAAKLFGAQSDGDGELVVVLGRALPDDDEVRALATGRPPPPALQVLRQAIAFAGFSHPAIEVLLGGCRAVLVGGKLPRCEVATGRALTLWVGVPPSAAIAVRLDGAPLAGPGVARSGGSRFALEARSGTLSVSLGDRAIAAWELGPAARFVAIETSDRARNAGRLAEAAAALDAAAPTSDEERLEVVRGRAKLARLRGEPAEERKLRDDAIELARTLGRVSAESDETVAIMNALRERHALTEAAQLLPALDVHGVVYPEGAARRDWMHGLLASDLGDLGAALADFERALVTLDRIGDVAGRGPIIAPMADVLQLLGRDAEAHAMIDAERERVEREADVCARVDALTNTGWLLRDRAMADAPQQFVDQAVALAQDRCPRLVPIALVNQGWLLAAAHRLGDARRVLDRLATLEPQGRVATWKLRLEGEIVLGEDPARAERHAGMLATNAAAWCSSEEAYEAHLLRARALVALARTADATAAFHDAERALTLWSRLVPLGEGRDTFFERHDQLALTAIPFFLAQIRRGAAGADIELAAMVQRSIARFVNSLAASGRARTRAEHGDPARDRTAAQFALAHWPEHAAAAPPGPALAGVCAARDAAAGDRDAALDAPSEDALLVHPTQQGWLVIVWRRRGAIAVREIAGATGDVLAQRIADAAAPLLAGAGRVHLHVHRSIAALPLDRSIAARLAVPVALGVDAPPRPNDGECRGERRALLVTNPQRNLWQATDAAPVIRDALARIGFAVDALDGPAATRAAIEQRLADPCTALFEYDGHAVAPNRPSDAPRDRIDDALLLADGTLTAADVLVLGRVPPAIVLDGCTTAAPEGLGLAHAFVLAGASQVVASLDEVPADAAARFTRGLFDNAAAHGALDLVALFARAIQGADLPALRVYER